MNTIELIPDLSSCIETVTRREYSEVTRKLLETDNPDEELIKRAEILRLFLENADFRKLRAESERHLLKGQKVKFVVRMEGKVLKYDMQVFWNRSA